MTNKETLILVDEKDRPCGTQEKLVAHVLPQRHRAFSIFIFNRQDETLIQRRALGKYHSPGLWANSCCGHPRPEEKVDVAAQRRLGEELGFTCILTPVVKVCYTLKLEKNLWELEFTHVFRGEYEEDFRPNPEEVMEIQWISPEALRQDVLRHPQAYTRWFRLYILKHYKILFPSFHHKAQIA
ncbi:MAG: Isopentenyl-diphosphate delta-isomerase [uncultured bacterium]|nr:MAG: Isopentenyl-diphosphate delta-isomerase [uncultured bacterium]OFW67888.1 MAG: isopentenyl-diphosphate delta-isomerase [Alphaproteobacteria bacterium GWC2_42_16]OFW73722.1 MAG: isopentenyl-diphosphate delta-isomerase [Alphaproteobacteria bacterium GWA2_41_27]OFW82132.1 MAG: isopentenyl-diphosphate delta-isomerase [Alphaproteobacteria bacterium RIFCSPHIGHO2_12_FULL_42_100]OFW85211.1 MAG: isopentenyl-diphosphate delta-isomerase [Alphaproteobacteria bacterium RBG_16_42_14]OFW90851.1 MAG: i